MHACFIKNDLHACNTMHLNNICYAWIVPIINFAGCALTDSSGTDCITNIPDLPAADLACTVDTTLAGGSQRCPPACRTSIQTLVRCHACMRALYYV